MATNNFYLKVDVWPVFFVSVWPKKF